MTCSSAPVSPTEIVALVADQDQGGLIVPHDQYGFLEPGIESGEVGEVGAVLPVRIDDEPVVASLTCACDESIHTIGVDRVWDPRRLIRHAEIGQLNLGQVRLRHRSIIARSVRR